MENVNTQTSVSAAPRARAAASAQGTAAPGAMGFVAPLIGWIVPGAGHLIQRRWIRGLLLMLAVVAMFVLGVLMQGKIYTPNTGEVLEMLGFVADLGGGALYAVGRALNLGQGAVQIATADYGTKYIIVAGLLNIIAAVDAHNIAIGKKP